MTLMHMYKYTLWPSNYKIRKFLSKKKAFSYIIFMTNNKKKLIKFDK